MERFLRAWDNKNSCIVHIRELPKSRNGAKCDCVCVECKGSLEALQGEVNNWSFRHQSSTTCNGGPMTALHTLAQELLCGDRIIKTKGGDVSYSKAIKEWSILESRFRADVAGTKADGAQFLIEIFVTHKLTDEDEKVKHLRESKLHSIEIDLSKVDPDINKESLLEILLTDTSKQKSIYSPEEESSGEKVIAESQSNQNKLSWFEVALITVGVLWVCNKIKQFLGKK